MTLLLVTAQGCTYVRELFASSASSASLGSLSASSGSSAISHSVNSIISSPSEAVAEQSYGAEVTDYTYAFLTFPPGKNDLDIFNQGLGKIALRNGIIDWENNPKTYVAIGKGLKKANIKGQEYEEYKKKFSGSDYARTKDIERGYDSYRMVGAPP